MSTKDILIYETGNGGDIAVINNDIALAEQLYQQAYLALFGGNVEADTKGNELATEVRNDWWGNSLLMGAAPQMQFNSKTERALRDNPLNSKGRINIKMAVETDLAYLKTVANITVNVSINGPGKLTIDIKLDEPANQQSVILRVLWDSAKKELIINKII